MPSVQEGFSAIAEMIAVELGSAPAEVDCWKELMRGVDVQWFQKTGEIVVRDPAPAKDNARKVSSTAAYDREQVRDALQRLRVRMRTSRPSATAHAGAARKASDVPEPDYNSADSDLWLYGPLC